MIINSVVYFLSLLKVRAFNMTSISGTTCLHNAVQSGNTTMIKYLIHQDCDINAQDCNGWYVV